MGWFSRHKKDGSPSPDRKQPVDDFPTSHSDSKDSKPKKGPHTSDQAPTEAYDAPPPAYSEYAGPSSSTTAGPSSSSSKTHPAPPPPADWESAVPDTSALPPPPNVFSAYLESPARNATEDSLKAGLAWCKQNPLYAPLVLPPDHLSALWNGDITLFAPQAFKSLVIGAPEHRGPGIWRVRPLPKLGRGAEEQSDYCLATYPPLYSALAHHPLQSAPAPPPTSNAHQWWTKQIYFELRISRSTPKTRDNDIPLALGYVANPYPYFRLPGWHRASLGVHGDDGHRYVNDAYGGKEFVDPFRAGDVVGLGMRFGPGESGIGVKVYVFFTRNGREVSGWDLHEENDSQSIADGGVAGLDGNRHDLYAAVGVYGRVEFDVVFDPASWEWKGGQ